MHAENSAIIISPFEVILDKETKKGELLLRNITKKDYAFKIKTTHPENYKVKPSMGILDGHKELHVSIELVGHKQIYDLSEHRFLFQFVESAQALTNESLKQIFLLKGIKTLEQKISIRYAGALNSEDAHSTAEPNKDIILWLAIGFIIYCTAILFRKILFGV